MTSPTKKKSSRPGAGGGGSPLKGLASSMNTLSLNNGSSSSNPNVFKASSGNNLPKSRPTTPGGGLGSKENGNRSPKKKMSKKGIYAQTGQSLSEMGGVGKNVYGGKTDLDPSRIQKTAPCPKKKSSKGHLVDRVMPRVEDNAGSASQLVALDYDLPSDSADPGYSRHLSQNLGVDVERRILSFQAAPPVPVDGSINAEKLLAQYKKSAPAGSAASGGGGAKAASARRRIATTPERILDAPGLVDDYYLNLLSWSCQNVLAIALADTVYIWNAETGSVEMLCCLSDNDTSNVSENSDSTTYICSVNFSEDGSYLSIGTSVGEIQMYDLGSMSRIRTIGGHIARVPTLSWSGAILSSGSQTGEIWNSDVRIANHKVAEMKGHRGEVCGLVWRKEAGGGLNTAGQGLLASGGNDNVVNVWDGRMLLAPKMSKTNHTAAVKALSWCPWNQSVLASGGGSSDKSIHFWNVNTGSRLHSITTPSQVTSLIWNPHEKEILSSHGYPDHQLSIWSYPSLTKVQDIDQAHDTRILHSALSPDGTTIATASADENLKFWKVFEIPKKQGGIFGDLGRVPKETDDILRGKKGHIVRSIR